MAALVEHALLDHLPCLQHYRGRDRQAERLSGLEVDDELELRGLLDGQVGEFTPLRILSTNPAARRYRSMRLGP